MIPSHKCSC